jgi:CubicO group peptidase (beta-lactamase class C family)
MGLAAEPAVAAGFEPAAEAFGKLVARGDGGGALVVRLRGETVADLWAGHADAAGTRPWTRDTLAISFSTTKGIASAVVHRLVEQGVLDYDEPVATFWPAFAAGGKSRVTVRHLLTHRAGLHSVQAVADSARDLLDHELMETRLAARKVRAPETTSAYHAITYGWLVSGLVRAATGRGLGESVEREIATPLGIDGLHIGAPQRAREQVAEPVGSALRHIGATAERTAAGWKKVGAFRTPIEALHVRGFHNLFEGDEPPIWEAEMPAVNGLFSAGALARLYGALANGGADAGARLLSPESTHELGRVQLRSRDRVLGLPMRWRLGYHHAFGTGREAPMAFGHYGFGGSGGWGDPQLGLSLGYVTNRVGSTSTPLGDLDLFRLSGVVHRCARELAA